MPNAYPTSDALNDRLVRCGLPNATIEAQDLDGAIQWAISEFERITGYHPFLAPVGSAAKTLKFDGPRGLTLELETGFVAISQVKSGGRVLVEDTDYVLHPRNAHAFDKPYTLINFSSDQTGALIEVTGRLGYTENLDDATAKAILDGAGGHIGPELTAAQAVVAADAGGALIERESGDTRIKVTAPTVQKTSAMKYEPEVWASRFESAAKARRLIVLGLNY